MNVVQSYKGPTIYATNHVSDSLVTVIKKALETYSVIHISFDVIGRTCHRVLSQELAIKLGDGYEVTIGYNYGCSVKRIEKGGSDEHIRIIHIS